MRKIITTTNCIVKILLCISVIGCAPTYLLEYNDHQFYVEYPKDQIVKVGDTFVVYNSEKKKRDRNAKPAPPKYTSIIVGKIIIIGAADETHGMVKLLQGQLEEGFILKKEDDKD